MYCRYWAAIRSRCKLSPLWDSHHCLPFRSLTSKSLSSSTDFRTRTRRFEEYRKRHKKFWPNEEQDGGDQILLSLVNPEKLVHLLARMLDEKEFLSPGGIRALSKDHENNPYTITIHDEEYTIRYDPGDSTSDMFGGNSNWRGPVWMPINYLFIQSVRRYGEFYGDNLLVEYPARSGNKINLCAVADELSQRVISLFTRDKEGNRRYNGHHNWFYNQKGNENLVLFFEYFNGDNGHGLGAAHQTGWTALIAELISEQSRQLAPTNAEQMIAVP